MGYRCEVKKIDGVYYVSGQIDKTFRENVESMPNEAEISINLRDLISINSGGIREWVMLMLKMKNSQIELFECPKVFIDQVNTVKHFVPVNVRIMSFYVPYYNEKNGIERNVLFKLNEEYTDQGMLPLKKVFDEQGAELDVDVIEAKYFRFIVGLKTDQ